MRMQYVDRNEEILYLMRGRQLAYLKSYDPADRKMDLDFYRNLKNRYDYLKMIKYIRGERPNPHGKSWTEAKRILGVINVDDVYYWAVEILIKEGKIKVYDYNLHALDEVNFLPRCNHCWSCSPSC
ncbi:hypothetical protein P3L10_010684 [Capsicum annuum]